MIALAQAGPDVRVDQRLLVVTLSNIGDLVLTTPVLEALAARYPGVPIDVLGDARSIELLAAAPYIGTLFCKDKRAGWGAQLALLRRLRARRYGLVVDLRTPFLAYLLRAGQRLTKRRRADRDCHAVVDHFSVLARLMPAADPPGCRVYVDGMAQAAAAEMLRGLPGARWLALAPGANWPGKKWPCAHFRAMLELARADFDGVILVGSRADAADAATLADACLPTVQAAGRSSLAVAAALLARATLFVGNDSGPGHIAAALDIPTLTLFGPGRPSRYRPWGRHAALVQAPEGDLAALTPAAVYAALCELSARVAAAP